MAEHQNGTSQCLRPEDGFNKNKDSTEVIYSNSDNDNDPEDDKTWDRKR